MNHFECKLSIDELFNFFNKPRSIEIDDFLCIASHLQLNCKEFSKRIIDEDIYTDEGIFTIYPELFEVLESVDIVSSKREMRELLKNGSLFINNIQIKSEKFELTTIPFFETGVKNEWGNLKFAIIRVSKKKHEIIFTH